MNFPGADLGLDPLTPEDRAALDFVVAHADGIGLSFVETAAHVEQLQDEIAARRDDWRRISLIVKIETTRSQEPA